MGLSKSLPPSAFTRVPERVHGDPRGEPTAAGPADPQGVVSISFKAPARVCFVAVGSCALGTHARCRVDSHWMGCGLAGL